MYTFSDVLVRQVTGLLLSNLCKNIVKKLILKFIDIFLNQVLNFLNIFTEHGKIIADYTKSIERISQLFCGKVIVEGLYFIKRLYCNILVQIQNDWTV